MTWHTQDSTAGTEMTLMRSALAPISTEVLAGQIYSTEVLAGQIYVVSSRHHPHDAFASKREQFWNLRLLSDSVGDWHCSPSEVHRIYQIRSLVVHRERQRNLKAVGMRIRGGDHLAIDLKADIDGLDV
jgi:hypothetical protein